MDAGTFDVPSVTRSGRVVHAQQDSTGEPTSLIITGEDTDHAVTFASVNGNISSRPSTAAAVPWSPAPWTTLGEAGLDQQTADIASVIQKIVDRAGWSSGNALAILVTGTGERVAESYNGDQAGAPLLHVEYLEGSMPVAVDDTADTTRNTPVTTAVLANDMLGNDPTTITAVTQGTNGTVTFDPGAGMTIYTPNVGFLGTDNYTYTITDADGESDAATVSVNVITLVKTLEVEWRPTRMMARRSQLVPWTWQAGTLSWCSMPASKPWGCVSTE